MANYKARALLDADALNSEGVLAAIPHFSLKRTTHDPEEARLLREALTVSWAPSGPNFAGVATSYARFNQTLTWLRSAVDAPLRVDELLANAWRKAVAEESLESEIELAWAEFEGRRRLHYGLELLLSAIAGTLEDIRAGSLGEIVEAWLEARELPELLVQAWPAAREVVALGGAAAVATVPADLWLASEPPDGLADLSPAARALAGFALISGIARQSARLRSNGRLVDRGGWGEKALTALEQPGTVTFGQTLRGLAAVAAQAHMDTTFRKMASGLACSLRFFPEGQRLSSTGLRTGAGRSGPRLWNVIRILRDAGVDGLGASA
jgi:hypothetical protein